MGQRRSAMGNLIIPALLVSVTIALGVIFGGNLDERIAANFDTMLAESVSAGAVYRDDTLHLRTTLKHVSGHPVEWAVVSDFSGNGSNIWLGGTPGGNPYGGTLPRYNADGWNAPGGNTCTAWTVVSKDWPASGPASDPAPPTCTMHVYQQAGESSSDFLVDGNMGVLEFVVRGVDASGMTGMGVSVMYGRDDTVQITRNLGVTVLGG